MNRTAISLGILAIAILVVGISGAESRYCNELEQSVVGDLIDSDAPNPDPDKPFTVEIVGSNNVCSFFRKLCIIRFDPCNISANPHQPELQSKRPDRLRNSKGSLLLEKGKKAVM